MNDVEVQGLIARAAQARREGRASEARKMLEQVVAAEPAHPVALNALGLAALAEGDTKGGVALLSRAAEADPKAPPIWLNLAEAYRAAGDTAAELTSLERALTLDPYLLPALLKKAQAHERLGQREESVRAYRGLLQATPKDDKLPEPIRRALAHGRQLVAAHDELRAQALARSLEDVSNAFPGADFARARAYADQRVGKRKVYQQQPTGGHFPYLPAIEFFDRQLFPWFATLEAATSKIRAELLSLWDQEDEGFRPYVTFDPTAPVNQWAELNHSPRWSAWFLWKDGVRQEESCRRCPETARALEDLPLLDTPGKAPSVMFSVLEPHTRIPPHTGTSNVRTTVHLPLVVPDGCGFRVGAETRLWREGEAWAFDDTIEHEAWNDSDRPRAILILDVWNPLLTEAERAAVRAIG